MSVGMNQACARGTANLRRQTGRQALFKPVLLLRKLARNWRELLTLYCRDRTRSESTVPRDSLHCRFISLLTTHWAWIKELPCTTLTIAKCLKGLQRINAQKKGHICTWSWFKITFNGNSYMQTIEWLCHKRLLPSDLLHSEADIY